MLCWLPPSLRQVFPVYVEECGESVDENGCDVLRDLTAFGLMRVMLCCVFVLKMRKCVKYEDARRRLYC